MTQTITEPRAVPTSEQWLADRRTGIGASESPAVLGLSPWKSPFQLWSEKCGLIDPPDMSDNEPAEFGIRLERPIAEAFADRTGRKVNLWPQHSLLRAVDYPWLLCTPDAVQESSRGEGSVQIKTVGQWGYRQHWRDGPPLMYQVQCQHELKVTGFAWGTLVVLIGGQRLRYFDFERNDKFLAALIPKLKDFWRAIETRTPPEVDGSLVTAQVLAKLHPDDNGQTIVLPQEATDWTAKLEEAKASIKDAEEVKVACENRIKAALGDATFGLLHDGSRWSWKTQERKGYSVQPTVCRVLRKVK